MLDSFFSSIGRLFGHFSIVQKFILISCIFGISIIAAIAWMICSQNQAITTVTLEILGNEYERHIRKIYEHIDLHRNELKEILSAKKMDKAYLFQLEGKISAAFADLINYDKQVEEALQTNPNDFASHGNSNLKPEALERHWRELIQNSTNPEESNKAHLALIENLQALVLYITETSTLLQDPRIDNYYLIHTLSWLLTENLKAVPFIAIKLEEYQNNKTNNPQKAEEDLKQVKNWLAIFYFHLNETKKDIQKVLIYDKNINYFPDIEKKLQKPYLDLMNSLETYANFVEKTISSDNLIIKQEELINDIKNVYRDNFELSDVITDTLDQILQDRLVKLKRQQWVGIVVTLLLALVAFILGIAVMRSITQPLKQMMKAAVDFGKGDLTARVPIVFDDEVGKAGKAFNKMADSLQDLIKQLQWAGLQLTTSTTEIAETAQQQENTVLNQETAIKQIAGTAQDITKTIKDFAISMKDINDAAEKTSTIATAGQEGLNQMETTMHHMVDAASNIAGKLATLNEKASTITSVVTTISKVADQTNLLSLNAAIEAEKAGEHGRSFAVIAREIRRLADQTASATLDIERMVNEMISAVSVGVTGVDKFTDEINIGVGQVNKAREQLSHIIEQVQQLSNNFESVNEGMQIQFAGASRINDSIIQLSESAQKTTESIRHFHKSIEQLNNAAQELKSMVSSV